MKIYSQTHIGLKAKTNEDRHLIKELHDGSTLLVVADGLGGNVCGGIAAEMIKQNIDFINVLKIGNEQTQLKNIAIKLDLLISKHAEQDIKLDGMGSTFIGALVRFNQVYWVHVGDSRLYHFHKSQLLQITEDQTLARFLMNEGEITPREFETHYARQIMDQSIGCGNIEPETGQFSIEEGDQILLVSDGLYKYVSYQQIEKIIISPPMCVKEKTNGLVNAALNNGGKDNITVILLEI